MKLDRVKFLPPPSHGIETYRTLSPARLHFGPSYWSIFLNVYLKDFFFHFGESRAMKGVILV